jgi:hypothetical protein
MRQAMVEAKAPVPGRRGVLDLEAQFAFFRSQHRHPVNAAAHALLSWPILFTNLLILHFLPLPSPLDPALALALAYAATYVAVDRRAGVLAGILFLGAWAASRALVEARPRHAALLLDMAVPRPRPLRGKLRFDRVHPVAFLLTRSHRQAPENSIWASIHSLSESLLYFSLFNFAEEGPDSE